MSNCQNLKKGTLLFGDSEFDFGFQPVTEPDHNAVFARFLDWSFKLHLLGVDRGLEPGINERRDLLAIHGSKEPAGFAHLFLHLKLRRSEERRVGKESRT